MHTPNISRAVEGFLLAKAAKGLAVNTLRDYEVHLQRFVERTSGACLHELKSSDVNEFFRWLRFEFIITMRGNQSAD